MKRKTMMAAMAATMMLATAMPARAQVFFDGDEPSSVRDGMSPTEVGLSIPIHQIEIDQAFVPLGGGVAALAALAGAYLLTKKRKQE